MMANPVAYPDIALEKFTGLDPTEDATKFIDIMETKIAFSLGLRPAAAGDEQDLFDHRRRALFGSVMRGPAQDWFATIPAAENWANTRAAFIARFTDNKDKYLLRIEAENIKRQENEPIKAYIYRVIKIVDKGWNEIAAAERVIKYKDYFLKGLTPASLKQNAYRQIIENPAITWQQLKDHVINKDVSYSISTNITGVQNGSSDSRLANMEEQIKKMTELLQSNKIHATYDPNDPRFKQNGTRFCNYCKKNGHTIAYCEKLKRKEMERQKSPKQRPETYSDKYPGRGRSSSRDRHPQDRGRDSQNYSANRYDSRGKSPYDGNRQSSRGRSPYDGSRYQSSRGRSPYEGHRRSESGYESGRRDDRRGYDNQDRRGYDRRSHSRDHKNGRSDRSYGRSPHPRSERHGSNNRDGYRNRSSERGNSAQRSSVQFENRQEVNALFDYFKSISPLNQSNSKKNTDNKRNPKRQLFIDLTHYSTQVSDPKEAIEAQFLVDTGATCSLINYPTFVEINRIQNLKLVKEPVRTCGIGGNELHIIGYVYIVSSFDVEGNFPIRHKVWIFGPGGTEYNILGIDFLSQFGESLKFSDLVFSLKAYPGQWVSMSPINDKSFPFLSSLQKVALDFDFCVAPRSTRVISVFPQLPQINFEHGTTFLLHKDVRDTGIYTYNVYCRQAEKEIPILLNNPLDHKISVKKGTLGFTSRDITASGSRDQAGFMIANNVAFVEEVRTNFPEFEQHFEVCKVSQTVYDNRDMETFNAKVFDELATDFSKESKSLQPKAQLDNTKYRNKQLDENILTEYSKTEKEFLRKFDFSETDLTDDELEYLIRILIEDKDVYSHHKYDVGKINQKFHVKLKENSELKKQRPSRVPLHYQSKLETLLEELQKAEIIREMGDDIEMGSMFINPVIILPKGDIIKLVIDARYLNSITDLSSYSWPLEPLTTLLTRINGKYFTSSDLSSAYNQVPLTDDTQRLTSFVIGSKQYTFMRGFYGLCGLPNFFSRIMTIHFAPLIKRKKAITYIDDTLMQASSKSEMFDVILEYHRLLRSAGLKAAPDKTKFFLKKVQFLGHVVSEKGIQPVAKKVAALKALKSPENKQEVMRVLGCLGFYSSYIKNLHVDSKPFHELTKDGVPFKWTDEHEKLFQDIKDRISEDTVLAIPSDKYAFHIHVDSSSVGTGSILIQDFPEGKRIVSFNSRIFNKAEQKMSTMHRELCGIVSALQIYEHLIIGSRLPIYVYCDHKPILYLWARRGKLSHRFFRYQLIITQFQNLKIIWTPGKNLAFPDILSRNMSLTDIKKHQLKHKRIPKEIKFYDENGSEIKYFIDHDEDEARTSNDFFPIISHQNNTTRTLMFEGPHQVPHEQKLKKDNLSSITDINVCFQQGKEINQQRKLSLSSNNESDTDESHTYSEVEWLEDEPFEESVGSDDEDYFCQILSYDANFDREFSNEVLSCKQMSNMSKDQEPIIESMTPTALNSNEFHLQNPKHGLIKKLQLEDPVLSEVIEWIQEGIKPKRSVALRHSKALTAYYRRFENLQLDSNTNVLMYHEPQQNTDNFEPKICLPLSLFLSVFELAHNHPLAGHMGVEKTLQTIKQFFYWPGMQKWVTVLINDCLTCQQNKHTTHQKHEAPLEHWNEDIPFPFHTVHIDHKGPLNPPSKGKKHCLVIVDSFSRFIQVYPVKTTSASDTIKALEKFITSFGIPQKLVYDRGTAFMNTDFAHYLKELGITHAPRTAYSPWTNGKVETQNKHLGRYFRQFLSDSGSNWSELASKFSFAHNTTVNYGTGLTPYEILFGQKPHVPLSLKLGLSRTVDLNCSSPFCEGLPLHQHSSTFTENNAINPLLLKNSSSNLLKRENQFKTIYANAYKKSMETTDRSHYYRNRYKLAKPLKLGQKVLLENHSQPLDKSKKLCSLRSGPFTVSNVITDVTYEVTHDTDQSKKVVHRNHLIEYYPKEDQLPELISNYAPLENQNEIEVFYRNLNQDRVNKANRILTNGSFRDIDGITIPPPIQINPQAHYENLPPSHYENLDQATPHKTPRYHEPQWLPESPESLARSANTPLRPTRPGPSNHNDTPHSQASHPSQDPMEETQTDNNLITRDRASGRGLRPQGRHNYYYKL